MSNIEIAKKYNYIQLNVTEYIVKEISQDGNLLIKSRNSGTTTHKNSDFLPISWGKTAVCSAACVSCMSKATAECLSERR